MNRKSFFIYMIISIVMTIPNSVKTQVKSIHDLRIVQEELTSDELEYLKLKGNSPLKRFTISKTGLENSILDNSTGEIHKFSSPGITRNITWSNNEDKIAFLASRIPLDNRGATSGVGIYSFKDEDLKIINPNEYLLLNPTISPDGKKVLCTGSTNEGKTHLLIIDTINEEIDILEKSVSSHPVWGSNSEIVLFTQRVGKAMDALYALDIYTNEKRHLGEAGGMIDRPQPSPDGNMVVYSVPTGSGNHLFLTDIKGENIEKLTSINFEGNYRYRWSPDSKYISFERPVVAGHYGTTISSDLFLYDIKSHEERLLSNVPLVMNSLVWWVDESTIIIASGMDGSYRYTKLKLSH